MNIFERLTQDHDRHRGLAQRILKTSGDSSERRSLWSEFRAECIAHAAAEEQSFYSSLIADPDGQSQSRHSIVEHKVLDELVADLTEVDFSSSAWLLKFRTLQDKLEHHMVEEERDVFPLAQGLLSDAEAEEMVSLFEARKSESLSAS